MPQAAIQGIDVSKTYIMGEVQVPVLRHLNFEIFAHQITVILGASGAGKSTLLNLIGGIDRPSSGQILFNGQDIAPMSDRKLTRHRRENVGFVFQFYNLVPTLTAIENVEVSTQIASNPMSSQEALNLVELGDKLDYFPAQLSGGQQQRVSIARALAKKPAVMFCDEPTGALDAKTGRKVLELLLKLNEQTKATIVIVTHASSIAQLGHRVLHLTMDGITAKENKVRKTAAEVDW